MVFDQIRPSFEIRERNRVIGRHVTFLTPPYANNPMPSTKANLRDYRAKRDFTKTRESSGETSGHASGHSYLIQKHAASRLHYDFRLELDGVLKSWAVTRGPAEAPERAYRLPIVQG